MAAEELPEPVAVAQQFAALLDRLRIRYVIGGSFASSVHGEPRSTNDIDVVVDLSPAKAIGFGDALGPEWYLSRDAMREAIATGGSFNIIHIAAGLKIDLFVAGNDAFDHERLQVREVVDVGGPSAQSLFVDTAEHVVLRKLEWFRRGGETSERQWRDVVAILRVNRGRLESARLIRWAQMLGVSDLLLRAQTDAER